MKFLRALAFLFVGITAHAAPAAGQEMYSFADLYRVTVGEAVLPPASQPGPAFQVRPASEGTLAPAAPSPYVFTIASVAPHKGGGLLLLAGLAAALWVARRRLGYAIRA